MRLGMEIAAKQMSARDALLMLNDDVEIGDDFLERLWRRANELGPRVVIGCQQQDLDAVLPSFFGYTVNYLSCNVQMLTDPPKDRELIDVDALCGRGTLISSEVISRIGHVDSERFPHFWGDIEYTARAKDMGFRTVCDPNIVVSTSFQASDRKRIGGNHWRRFISPFSSWNILHNYRFWSSRGPKPLARTALFRFPLIKCSRALIKIIHNPRLDS